MDCAWALLSCKTAYFCRSFRHGFQWLPYLSPVPVMQLCFLSIYLFPRTVIIFTWPLVLRLEEFTVFPDAPYLVAVPVNCIHVNLLAKSLVAKPEQPVQHRTARKGPYPRSSHEKLFPIRPVCPASPRAPSYLGNCPHLSHRSAGLGRSLGGQGGPDLRNGRSRSGVCPARQGRAIPGHHIA